MQNLRGQFGEELLIDAGVIRGNRGGSEATIPLEFDEMNENQVETLSQD